MNDVGYILGDHYLMDDETGLKIRASDSVKRWDGAMVHRNVVEPRHPQDTIKIRPERPMTGPVRSMPDAVFTGPLRSEVEVAVGPRATSLTLTSAVRMLPGDRLQVMQPTGEPFETFITLVVDTQTINISPPLPRGADAGALVVDLTALAEPIL